MFFKIGALKNFAILTGKHPCFFNKVTGLKICETPAQVFSYVYWEIFKNSLFYRTPPVAAFDMSRSDRQMILHSDEHFNSKLKTKTIDVPSGNYLETRSRVREYS